eukprot:scaffold270809_cov24-Tisochrysis_lutea.AAC.1
MAKARSEAVLDVIEAELKVAGEGRKGLGSCEHLQGRCLNSKRACYQICPGAFFRTFLSRTDIR